MRKHLPLMVIFSIISLLLLASFYIEAQLVQPEFRLRIE